MDTSSSWGVLRGKPMRSVIPRARKIVKLRPETEPLRDGAEHGFIVRDKQISRTGGELLSSLLGQVLVSRITGHL
jgi:hypothetical protein